MAKLVFPQSGSTYRAEIGALRTFLQGLYNQAQRFADFKTAIAAQLVPFAIAIGYTGASNQKVLTTAVKVTAPATTGAYVNGYTFTIANGVITAVVAS